MNTLVTGSEGFIGRHVMAALPDAVGFDIEHGMDLTEGVPAFDRYIHLAAEAGIETCRKTPMAAFNTNVRGTLKVLEAARNHRGSNVVFASSAAAANSTNPYGASKRTAEIWCETYQQTYGVNVNVLRLANVYGPGSLHKTSVVASMCKSAIEDGCIVVHGDGTQCRDFVHVREVVRALIMEHVQPLQCVETGCLTTVNELAHHIAELSGADIIWKYFANEYRSRGARFYDRVIELDYTPWREGVAETFAWFKEALSPSENPTR